MREECAAIVIDAGAGANHNFVVKHRGAPGHADARSNAPLPAGQSGAADAALIGHDEAGGGDVTGVVVESVLRGVEIIDASVFFGEAAVPVIAYTEGDAEVGAQLVFVLEIETSLSGAKITVGVALQV